MNGDEKCRNWGGSGVRGHSMSSAIYPFDRAHITSYSTIIQTMRLSCTVFELLSLISQNLKRHVTVTTPTQGTVCNPNAKASHVEPVYKI